MSALAMESSPKATFDRARLSAAVSACALAIEKREHIPILSNVAILPTFGGVTVEGTDLDVSVKVRVPCEAVGSLRATVAAKGLSKALRASTAVSVDLAMLEDSRVALTLGGSRLNLPTLPVADFPDPDLGTFTHRLDCSAAAFHAALAAVSFCISKEETRYYLNGIFVHHVTDKGSPRLRFAATDGHRLGVTDLAGPLSPDLADMPGIIIPREAIAILEKLLAPKAIKTAACGQASTLSVDISDKRIRVTCGTLEIVAKLIDGTFPDYMRVLPQANSRKLTMPSSDLAAAVKRATVLQDARGRAMRVDLSKEACKLTVINPEAGETVETVRCHYLGDPMGIGFNSSYLAAILAQFGDGGLVAELEKPGSPVLFTSPASVARYVLMPMRV